LKGATQPVPNYFLQLVTQSSTYILSNVRECDDCPKTPPSGDGGKKKWQADYIAPLQPPTLAIFRSWGSSAGAGRVRPAGAKISVEHLSAERR
jgi:hypothetical protein